MVSETTPDGKAARGKTNPVKLEYWDYWRDADLGGGKTAKEFLFAEMNNDTGWFQLWPIEDVLQLNESYQVEQFHPNYFGFGSSGGGVMFAFKRNASESSTVFGIPFDSIDANDIVVVAETFVVFKNAMGYSSPGDA